VVLMDWEERLLAMRELAATGQVFPVGLFIAWPVSNPFGIEGYKTIAYELYCQLGPRIDAVVFPCARGNGLYGTWKGFCELLDLGLIASVPRMIGVQPEGAASLPAAFAASAAVAAEVEEPHSIATSIRERVASDDALRAIYGSEGMAVAVSDSEILSATKVLAAEGLCVELASGAAYAGTRRLASTGELERGQVVACVLTSAGIKWPADLARFAGPPLQRAVSVAEAVGIALGTR
jgi:threonine synthase